jgi:hypothetical protein
MNKLEIVGLRAVTENRTTSYWHGFKSALLGCCMLLSLSACAETLKWKEDVRMLDGRVIVVTQEKRCGGGDYKAKTDATCLAREAWVTINLPEISNKEIVWHESLDPMSINVYEGKLYIVGRPPTSFEFRKYGAVNPPYIGFVWSGGDWQRIPFSSIPKAIYDGNMLIESIPKTRTDHVSLDQKKPKPAAVIYQRNIESIRTTESQRIKIIAQSGHVGTSELPDLLPASVAAETVQVVLYQRLPSMIFEKEYSILAAAIYTTA